MNDPTTTNETAPEKFELAFRILGNEVIAFSFSSQSTRKNFVMIGVILMLFGSIALNQLLPIIQLFM